MASLLLNLRCQARGGPMEITRILVQMHAEEYLKKNDPLGWFEAVYAAAKGDELTIPWVNLSPNPHLVEWLDTNPMPSGKKALVVGCGLGDDAEELSRRGFSVTAFDISPTAIEWCRKRYPLSKARYETQDLFKAPAGWKQFFDLVVEIYTLQSLQSPLREQAIQTIARFAAPQGIVLAITRAKEANEFPEGPPWPVTKSELALFSQAGLKPQTFDDFKDLEDPPIRRFRAAYQRPT